MPKEVILFLAIIVGVYVNAQAPEVFNGEWDKSYSKFSGANSSLTIFRFPVEQEGAVARVIVSCNTSDAKNPLLVVFRERTAILSLQVPIIIQNYEYSKVGRTLCPFSQENDETMTVEISSFRPVLYSFKATIINNFLLEMDKTREVWASASEPIYFEYRIPKNVDSVVVHVDSNSTACMTVSIQRIGCPVFDLANNVISTGIHQTMTTSGSVSVERSDMDRFYIIFVVNSNDNMCSEMLDIVPNKPTRVPIRRKTFNVTIESASIQSDYILPVSVALSIIGFIYLVALIYIVADNKSEREFIQRSYTIMEEESSIGNNRQRVVEELMRTDEDLEDYDTLPDCWDKNVIRAKMRLTVADLSLKPWKHREKKYNIYWVTLATIGLFYGLPVVQLVLTWQNTVRLSGDLDLCWYNFRCAKPFGGFFAFNNVFSNIGYVLLGLLLIIINKQREMRYRDLVDHIPRIEHSLGIPQHGGLTTAIGVSVILEGILSASYHICPSNSNYQFDTSFMYVIGMMGMLKLYQLRHPDVNANAHVAFAVVAIFILIAMAGVYLHNLAFWAIFSITYMLTILAVSVQFYFKGVWKLNLKEQWNSIRYAYATSRRCSCIIPTYAGRFIFLLLANLINFTFLTYGVINRPKDFSSFLLLPFIANLFLYIVYYIVMKVGYREKIHPRSWVMLFLAFSSWVVGSFFFENSVSDWSRTPAKSRELNQQCLVLKFFDNHDMWHFFSSISIFLSFSLMNRIDDDLLFVPRDEIIVF